MRIKNAIIENVTLGFEDHGIMTSYIHVDYGGGGGGFGNPYEREAEKVLSDVKNEYVSIDKANEEYGVVINNLNGEYTIDSKSTERIRNLKD